MKGEDEVVIVGFVLSGFLRPNSDWPDILFPFQYLHCISTA
jgi:hypothetical protein